MKTYKATCEYRDGRTATLEEELEELTEDQFKRWKYGRAVEVLKPNAGYMRFFINNVEQFANDTKRR